MHLQCNSFMRSYDMKGQNANKAPAFSLLEK